MIMSPAKTSIPINQYPFWGWLRFWRLVCVHIFLSITFSRSQLIHLVQFFPSPKQRLSFNLLTPGIAPHPAWCHPRRLGMFLEVLKNHPGKKGVPNVLWKFDHVFLYNCQNYYTFTSRTWYILYYKYIICIYIYYTNQYTFAQHGMIKLECFPCHRVGVIARSAASMAGSSIASSVLSAPPSGYYRQLRTPNLMHLWWSIYGKDKEQQQQQPGWKLKVEKIEGNWMHLDGSSYPSVNIKSSVGIQAWKVRWFGLMDHGGPTSWS